MIRFTPTSERRSSTERSYINSYIKILEYLHRKKNFELEVGFINLYTRIKQFLFIKSRDFDLETSITICVVQFIADTFDRYGTMITDYTADPSVWIIDLMISDKIFHQMQHFEFGKTVQYTDKFHHGLPCPKFSKYESANDTHQWHTHTFYTFIYLYTFRFEIRVSKRNSR